MDDDGILPHDDLAERRRRVTRDAVVAAAWDLARRDGIASLSMRDLAAAVGVRAPSLYHHFANKDAIHDAMFAQGHRAVDRRLAALQVPDDPAEALVAGVVAWLDLCREDWTRYQLLHTRTIPGWTPSDEAYAASLASFERIRRTAAAAGIVDTDLDLLTATVSGLASQQFANDPDGDRWTRLAPRAVRMLLADVADRAATDPAPDDTHRPTGTRPAAGRTHDPHPKATP